MQARPDVASGPVTEPRAKDQRPTGVRTTAAMADSFSPYLLWDLLLGDCNWGI